MIKISDKLISVVSESARRSPRLRGNFNLHKDYNDPVQRLINALEPSTYIRPHRHLNPDKVETILILRGRVVAVEFKDDGSILDHIVLDQFTGNLGVEFSPDIWHSCISLLPGSAIYELKNGPFSPLTKENFANWAPEENKSNVPLYIESVLSRLGIKQIVNKQKE